MSKELPDSEYVIFLKGLSEEITCKTCPHRDIETDLCALHMLIVDPDDVACIEYGEFTQDETKKRTE